MKRYKPTLWHEAIFWLTVAFGAISVIWWFNSCVTVIKAGGDVEVEDNNGSIIIHSKVDTEKNVNDTMVTKPILDSIP